MGNGTDAPRTCLRPRIAFMIVAQALGREYVHNVGVGGNIIVQERKHLTSECISSYQQKDALQRPEQF